MLKNYAGWRIGACPAWQNRVYSRHMPKHFVMNMRFLEAIDVTGSTFKNSRLQRLLARLQRINEQRHLYSIRTAFISTMPVMIVGAYATVLNNLPIAAYQAFMEQTFGAGWRSFGALVWNGTTQVLALLVVCLICANLAEWYNNHRNKQVHSGICGMVGLAAYIIVSLQINGAGALPFAMVGVTGLFVAMVVSVLAGEMFIRLCARRRTLKMLSDDPNAAVPQSFASVGPALLVITLFALFRMGLVCFGVESGLADLFNDIMRTPFSRAGDSFGTGIAYSLFTHLMWLFGIHGNNVLDGVAQSVFVPAMQANTAAVLAGAPPPYLITKTLFDVFVYMGGSGTTLALLAALMLFGRGRSYRTLMRFALPNSIFNINEPLIFGIPIVLNPIYALPFVLTPMVMLGTTTLAMSMGLVPYTVAEVNWATPVFVSGYIATGGSWLGVLLQAFNLCLAAMIYAPFVYMAEKMSQMRYQMAYKDLLRLVQTEYTVSPRRLINRVDEMGAVARNLANQLDSAIAGGEMYLLYQPIVDAKAGCLHSVEALLRWEHPAHGFVHPMLTIALAEETGRVEELGLWILEQAMAQRRKWSEEGLPGFHVAVNISTKQLNAPDFHLRVREILRRTDVPAGQLQVEITEMAALTENQATRDNLGALHAAGASIAMDDFGVGHSSLLYLRTQPITTLKIDGSLSREVTDHPENLDIIATIYDLCRLLEVDTIVEYVDNAEQFEKLMGIGTFLIQGYLFSKPLPGEEIPDFWENVRQREDMAEEEKDGV